MNKDSYINTADKECAYIVKKIIKKNIIAKMLNYKKHDLREAYYKTLLPIFFLLKL